MTTNVERQQVPRSEGGRSRAFDVIIVGGGAAGAVLANRLSAEVHRRVLLIEAGRAYRPSDYPEALRRQDLVGGDRDHDWGLQSEPGVLGHAIPLPRGKVLGGSTAINGAVVMHLPKFDHDRWARDHDLAGFGWEDVQPFFRSLKLTSGLDDRTNGPHPVHQLGEEEVSDQHRAFIRAAVTAGHPRTRGFTTEDPFGVGPYVMNTRMGVRLNTGMTMLSEAVRARPNLTIRDLTLVDTITFSEGRASGVRLSSGEELIAGEVILSAGTFASPAILIRSGIGPAEDVRYLGVPIVADSPVGRRLQDHPIFPTVWSIRKDALGLPYPPIAAMLWGRSRHASDGEADLNISTAPLPPGDDPAAEARFMLFAALVRPRSVGTLKVVSRDPAAAPIIDLRFLNDPSDRERLIDGVEMIREIASHAPLDQVVSGELVPGPAHQERAAISQVLGKGLTTYHHATSTVPMGGSRDPAAVVDEDGRVRGVEGLRVVDASIWPDVPSVATGFPTMMLAERVAARMVS